MGPLLSTTCGCTGSKASVSLSSGASIAAASESDIAMCSDFTNETVCIQAEVTITPTVTVGEIESFCVGDPVIGSCQGTPSPTGSCTFTVSQSICVQVPLTFAAQATAVPAGISCGDPGTGPCSAEAFCTYTIGYYQNHPEYTNALITAAGGSIILGIDSAWSELRGNHRKRCSRTISTDTIASSTGFTAICRAISDFICSAFSG